MTNEMTYLNIQEDVLSLRIENDTLRETIIELREKIEKMKNCYNCKYYKTIEDDRIGFCIKKECGWDLKE